MLVMLLGQGLLLLIFDGKLGEQANKSHKKQNTRCFPYICPSLVDGVTRYLYWDEVAGTRESGQGEHKLAYTQRVKEKKTQKQGWGLKNVFQESHLLASSLRLLSNYDVL
uniref:Putative ovule protein n=1 Tax=Solanum chacoense TaxID=4108 RepID=A0A0V0GRZ8_SOLCH